MGLKQILQNLSWETLISLPPSDLLALVVLLAAIVYGVGNLVLRLLQNP
jgi:hypothetical protein